MKTILVVDDEYALVETLTDLLTDEGYRVVSAANGLDGLERLKEESPDLVITDLMMPIADGRELVRGIRAIPKLEAMPIIMMTSSSKSVALNDPSGAIEVTLFLKKPCPWATLRDAVAKLLPNP
jgi:two-component system response regulator VicR